MSGAVQFDEVESIPAEAAAKLEAIGEQFQAAIDTGDKEAAEQHLFREFQLRLILLRARASEARLQGGRFVTFAH